MSASVVKAVAAALPLPDGDLYTTETLAHGPREVLTLELAGIAEEGCKQVTAALDPAFAARQRALHTAFDDQWNGMECAIRETAFAVGLEYGRRLARLDGDRR